MSLISFDSLKQYLIVSYRPTFISNPTLGKEGVTRMLRKMYLFVLLGPLALAGCATTAQDSAKAPKQGYVYVVGSKDSKGAVWICPEKPGKGECEPVRVILEE